MNKKLRLEAKIGLLLFAVFNLVNYFTITTGTKTDVSEFLLGGLIGLALTTIIIGMLPDTAYIRLKSLKKKGIS